MPLSFQGDKHQRKHQAERACAAKRGHEPVERVHRGYAEQTGVAVGVEHTSRHHLIEIPERKDCNDGGHDQRNAQHADRRCVKGVVLAIVRRYDPRQDVDNHYDTEVHDVADGILRRHPANYDFRRNYAHRPADGKHPPVVGGNDGRPSREDIHLKDNHQDNRGEHLDVGYKPRQKCFHLLTPYCYI